MDVKHPFNEGQHGCADFISQSPGEIFGLATQTRVHRLRDLMEPFLHQPGDNKDLIEGFASSLEEIGHLADAAVSRLEVR